MNVVTSTWNQLVRRRLWPVAVLLLVALVAIPVVLAREPEAADVPAPALLGETDVDDSLATPLVAQAADGEGRRRVLGVRKDPFKPAEVDNPDTTTQQATAPPSSGGSTDPGPGATTIKPPSFPSSTGGGGSTGVPAPLPYPVPESSAPDAKTYPAGSVVVRFGAATSDSLDRMVLPKFAPVGGSDSETPVLIYMGLTKDGKRAKFLVDASVEVDGDGVCKPHPSNCETIELRVGETEFLDVVDPDAGADDENRIVAQYQLDLVDIKRKGDADVK